MKTGILLRIAAVLLAVSLILSGQVSAAAGMYDRGGGNPASASPPRLVASSAAASPGEEVWLELRIENNPGVMVLNPHFSFDETLLSYVGFENGALSGWTVTKNGAVWLGEADDFSNGVILKLKLRASESAKNGEIRFDVICGDGDAFNSAEEPIVFVVGSGTIVVKEASQPQDPEEPDRSELAAAVSAAETLSENSFTVESWKQLEAALESARNVLNTAKTQAEIDSAVQSLSAAMSALVPRRTFLFDDVQDETAFYYTPVYWALERGITTGTAETRFSPEAACTRAQVVTFLWRAAGSPEPNGSHNPFADVPGNSYYEKAIRWAVEKQITTGMRADAFCPDVVCTRAQVVTFLWRFGGKPVPAVSDNPFKDVNAGKYYYDAVLRAVEKDVTKGTSPTTFSPNDTCTRGQIATFLYRGMK